MLFTDIPNLHGEVGAAPLCCYSVTSKAEMFPSKAPRFAQPVIISVAAARPLAGAVSLTRHSLAEQAVTRLW